MLFKGFIDLKMFLCTCIVMHNGTTILYNIDITTTKKKILINLLIC